MSKHRLVFIGTYTEEIVSKTGQIFKGMGMGMGIYVYKLDVTNGAFFVGQNGVNAIAATGDGP